ncbi:type 2 lantipeptide synthetase LanM family protein [Bacillus inaquosorum]|uniref:type 2 lanthipeptide synthetase LanM family protein n=1 Tax=Bacillus inaquosorum TaxID=483913 RepID=UPI003F1687E1
MLKAGLTEQSTKWSNASSLIERKINRENKEKWSEVAEKRFERWKMLVESDEAISLDDIMSAYQMDINILKHTLDQDEAEFTHLADHKEWLDIIQSVDNGSYNQTEIEVNKDILFFHFVKPFLKAAKAKLKEKLENNFRIGQYEELMKNFHPDVEIQLLTNLADALASISSRTIILELNVARVTGQLQGETSEDRASYYNEVMLNDLSYIKAIREEYVVLTRMLATKTRFWIDNVYEILSRYHQDKELLSEQFHNGQTLGPITGIDTGSNVSDSHKRGKTVAILSFDSGIKIVYKPRSLEIDEQFNRFIQFLNSKGFTRDLKTVQTLNRQTYGWTEFITYTECQNKQQVEHFYWRIGAYLAVLYAMNAVDFHHQNLIAHGEYPVLIDLESLLHNNSSYSDDSAFSKAHDRIERSVLRVGLLPRKIGSKQGIEGIDLSALGAQEGQVSPHKTTVIVDRNKDTVHIKEQNYPIPVSFHRPKLNGKMENAAHYQKSLILGFEEIYRFFINHKKEINAQMDLFKGISVRQILRGTARYANLLRISLHPDFMRDGLDREMILDKLWLDTKLNPHLRKIVLHEKRDLFVGDIPYFISKPEHTHLWDSQGSCISNFFGRSALEETKLKINNLNKIDFQEQVSFIRTAFLVLSHPGEKDKTLKRTDASLSVATQDSLDEAIKIGTYLADRAIEGEQGGRKDLSWIGSFVDNMREDQFKISPANSTLYEGVAGISLFFGYLGYITKDSRFTDISRQALVPVQKSLSTSKDISAFGGISSYLYVLDHLSVLWGERDIIEKELEPALERLQLFISKDQNNDILTGAAGTAIVLKNLYRRFHDEKIMSLIIKCGDQLIGNMSRMSKGAGWRVPANPAPASGFAHGASGISWALYEIYDATKEKKYKEAADQGLEFERSLFIPELNNWADIRLENGEYRNVNFTAWCNGAAGIGLSRALISAYNQQDIVKEEAITAVQTLLKNGFGQNHCLCHGDLGNLEILKIISEKLGREEMVDKVMSLSLQILKDIRTRGYVTGFEKHNESPSLMMGYSGIGLGLLKIYSPDKVPSILMLQSPKDLKL